MHKSFFTICGVLKCKDKILILKKGKDDYNYPNHWSFVGGFVKEFEAGEETVIREIKEETGIDARIIKRGDVFVGKDHDRDVDWVTLPFVCECPNQEVTLDHENQDFKWVTKEELDQYEFVPGVIEALRKIGFI